jgi:hypothetical protein
VYEIEEYENHEDHGWGFVIKQHGKIIRRFSHAEERTEELRASARAIAEEEKRKLEDPDIVT